MSNKNPEGGPGRELYRENIDNENLERMRMQIEAEGKHAILIPKEIVIGSEISELTELFKKEKISYRDIVFYSSKTGPLYGHIYISEHGATYQDIFTYKPRYTDAGTKKDPTLPRLTIKLKSNLKTHAENNKEKRVILADFET